jgi:hypothetical protein
VGTALKRLVVATLTEMYNYLFINCKDRSLLV